jgi:hydroxypyruvate isomerase
VVRLCWSAHVSWLFGEVDYLERVGAARRVGFTTIETAWPGADTRLGAELTRHGVGLALLNCPEGDLAAGERGFVCDPARREEAERAFLAAAELAGALGASRLNLLVGRARADVGLAAQRRAVVETLRAFAPEAAARGLRLLVEPLNEIENPGYLAPTPRAAAELIEQAGAHDALGLLLDVYHVARVGGDPCRAIADHGELIAHVQLADWPGRGQPGTGVLDLEGILECLDAAGYAGAVGLEYVPQGTTESSLAFLLEEPAPPCGDAPQGLDAPSRLRGPEPALRRGPRRRRRGP